MQEPNLYDETNISFILMMTHQMVYYSYLHFTGGRDESRAVNPATKSTEPGCSGLNSWSVLLSKGMFLSPITKFPWPHELADGRPLGIAIISLSSPLMGPALGQLQGGLTRSRTIPVLRIIALVLL